MRVIDLKLIRIVLAIVWMVTGVLSLGIFPRSESLEMLGAVGLHDDVALAALYGSASLDILLGVLTLTNPSQMLWKAQAVLIIAYSIIIASCLPSFLLHPFGPVLKNLPMLLLLWLLHENKET